MVARGWDWGMGKIGKGGPKLKVWGQRKRERDRRGKEGRERGRKQGGRNDEGRKE